MIGENLRQMYLGRALCSAHQHPGLTFVACHLSGERKADAGAGGLVPEDAASREDAVSAREDRMRYPGAHALARDTSAMKTNAIQQDPQWEAVT